jgi:hypothetical protein
MWSGKVMLANRAVCSNREGAASTQSKAPSPTNVSITHAYPPAFAALTNGSAATLFSSHNQDSINSYLARMQQSPIDTAALQRFNPVSNEGLSCMVRGPRQYACLTR